MIERALGKCVNMGEQGSRWSRWIVTGFRDENDRSDAVTMFVMVREISKLLAR